jgi:uncharacterized membrane protein
MNKEGMLIGEVLELVKPGSTINETVVTALAGPGPGSGEHRSPWFVRALVAVSAWIASLMILAFVFESRIVLSSGGHMLLGAMLVAAALYLRRRMGRALFLVQLSLALSLAGQVLLINGIGEMFRAVGATALAAIVMSVALIAFYPDKIHRFLSTLVAVGAAVIFVYTNHITYGLQALVAGLAGTAGHVWYEESRLATGKIEPIIRPVGYGLITGMFFLLIPSVIPPEFRARFGVDQTWLPATAALTALLILLEYRLLALHGALRNMRVAVFLFLGTTGLAVASFKAPGIIAALAMLVIGFHRSNRHIMGISLVFLVVFLSAFYYNLDITLLNKSYILLASGAILIVLRLFLTMVFHFEDTEAAHE